MRAIRARYNPYVQASEVAREVAGERRLRGSAVASSACVMPLPCPAPRAPPLLSTL